MQNTDLVRWGARTTIIQTSQHMQDKQEMLVTKSRFITHIEILCSDDWEEEVNLSSFDGRIEKGDSPKIYFVPTCVVEYMEPGG